jgi:hypothetical protein
MQFTLNVPNTYVIEQAQGIKHYAIFRLQQTKIQGTMHTIKRATYIFKGSLKKSSYSLARQYILEEFGEQSAEKFAKEKSYEWVSLWNKI